jgi:SanA protein
MKLVLRTLFVGILLSVVATFGADYWVWKTVEAKQFSNIATIEHRKVGLLLGTTKYTSYGIVNLYYKYRIEATVELYKAGKIDYVLISGDNSRKEYSEPDMMKEDLVAQGIPAEKIFLDFAGFRTLDSIVRCKEIFGEDNIIVISQKFHNERAIFIANNKGIDAIGYNAKDVDARYGVKVAVREKFARVKLMLDMLFDKQPKYLGERITIQ